MLELEKSRFETHKKLLTQSYQMYEEKKFIELLEFKADENYNTEEFMENNVLHLFRVLDLVPTFNECKSFTDNDSRKKCLTVGIQRFIQKNYPAKRAISIIKKNKLLENVEGKPKYYKTKVQFRISKEGEVTWAEGDSSNKNLNEMAEKVILSLPKMQPGIIDGKPVNVKYTIPVVVQVK